MRIKIVAAVDGSVVRRLREHMDAVPKGRDAYTETLLFHPKGAYGAPELVAIRVRGKRDEQAVAVHLGHDLRNQEEHVVEQGEKDRLVCKYLELGFQPVGEFNVLEEHYRFKEFFLRLTVYDRFGAFLTVERRFPGEDTQLFAEKQKRAVSILRELGVDPDRILDVDVRGIVVLTLLKKMAEGEQKNSP